MALHAVVPTLMVVATLFATAVLGETEKPRIDPSTLIGRHLAAIGAEKARKFRWRVIDGTCTKTGRFADVRGSVFAAGGSFPCLLNFTSGYTTTRLTIVFESDIQPTDGWLWDGRDFKAVGAGATGFGDLSGFMYMAPEFVKQGVFGGVLSAAWPLLEAEEAASRLEIKGTKQEKGLVLQVVNYDLRKEGRRAKLFFDTATWQHRATEHTGYRSIHRGIRTRSRGGKLTETFSDFENFDGISLPTRWLLILRTGDGMLRWEINLQRVQHADQLRLRRKPGQD